MYDGRTDNGDAMVLDGLVYTMRVLELLCSAHYVLLFTNKYLRIYYTRKYGAE